MKVNVYPENRNKTTKTKLFLDSFRFRFLDNFFYSAPSFHSHHTIKKVPIIISDYIGLKDLKLFKYFKLRIWHIFNKLWLFFRNDRPNIQK